MIEMETSKLTKAETAELLSKYLGLKEDKVVALIELLIKIGIISEYIFAKQETPE